MISFSGSHFRLPLLLRVSDKRVEPLPESEYSAPLRFQLQIFAPTELCLGRSLLQNGAAMGPGAGALHRLVRIARPVRRTANRAARRQSQMEK